MLFEITDLIVRFSARDGFDLKRITLLGWSEAQRNDRLCAMMRAFYIALRNGRERATHGHDSRLQRSRTMPRRIACPDSGFRGAGGDLGEVDPEMMTEVCESSGGIYRNGLTFLAGGTVAARDSGKSYSPKGIPPKSLAGCA